MNKIHRNRLQKLADHLKTVPPKLFTMRVARSVGDINTIVPKKPACAMGYIPTVMSSRERSKTWPGGFTKADVRDSFLTHQWGFNAMAAVLNWIDVTPFGDLYFWLFDVQWERVDDTPTGAAARIEWFLNHGLPENADAMRCGQESLCYNPVS